jgi:hypothetical protein
MIRIREGYMVGEGAITMKAPWAVEGRASIVKSPGGWCKSDVKKCPK